MDQANRQRRRIAVVARSTAACTYRRSVLVRRSTLDGRIELTDTIWNKLPFESDAAMLAARLGDQLEAARLGPEGQPLRPARGSRTNRRANL